MKQLFACILLLGSALAQNFPLYPNGQATPLRQANIFNGPLNSTGAYTSWSDFTRQLSSPLVTGVVLGPLPIGRNVTSTNLVYLDDNTGSQSGNYCPNWNFNNPNSLNGLDAVVNLVAGAGKFVNIVLAPASYNSNTNTPGINAVDSLGIYGQNWANLLDADCSGIKAGFPGSTVTVYSLKWQAQTRYWQGQYIFDPGTSAYWQNQTSCGTANPTISNVAGASGVETVTVSSTAGIAVGNKVTVSSNDARYNVVLATVTAVNAGAHTFSFANLFVPNLSKAATGDITEDAACVSGNSISFSGSSTPDGSGVTAFTWVKIGANAPLLDSWVGGNFSTGNGTYSGLNGKAWQISLSTSAGAQGPCDGTHCTVQLQNPYVGAVGDRISVINVPAGQNDLNCTAITCLVSGIGANTVTYADPSHSNCIATCTVAAGTLQGQRNMNMGQGNATIQVVQSGLPNPMEPPMMVWNESACNAVLAHYANNPNFGYIRCGVAVGGEETTTGLTGSNNWRWGSEPNFISFVYQYLQNESAAAQAANISCIGNMNAFDLPEGQIAYKANCGIGTNGYQMNDAIAILAGNCLTTNNSVQADWCLNFALYGNTLNGLGQYPITELQNGSQTNNGQGTSTPGLNNAGNTGSMAPDPPVIGNALCVGCPFVGLMPLAKTNGANDFEIYDLIDTMLAADPSYPGTGSITSGQVNSDATGTILTAGNNPPTFAAIAGNDFISLSGHVYTVTSTNNSTQITVTPSVGANLTNVSIKAYGNPLLYQIAYAKAFTDFTGLGFTYGGTGGTGQFTIGATAVGASGPPNYLGARRALGHELDIVQLGIPFGQTASTYCPTQTQANAFGCLPKFGTGSFPYAVGAGTAITQASFGQRIVRLTDSLSDPRKVATQNWVNIQGNGEHFNTFSTDDNYLCAARTGSNNNYIFSFNPTAFSPGPILWPGSTTGAYGFNTCGFSRITPGLMYFVTATGQLQSVNAATDTNKTVPGSTPSTLTTVNDFTLPADKCFGTAAAGGRYSQTGVPFNPLIVAQTNIADNDLAIGWIMSNVKNGCWNPSKGVIDWQASTAYTATACGLVSCIGITPMANNTGGHAYKVQTPGTSAATPPPIWCQTSGCTVNDGTVVWLEFGIQNSWGSNGTGHLANNCGAQGAATLLVRYTLHSNGTSVAGDCDLLDTGNAHEYHNGVDNGQVLWVVNGTPPVGGPYLFTLHGGESTADPNWLEYTSGGCIGVPGQYGAACATDINAGIDQFWQADAGVTTESANFGHAVAGFALNFGSVSNPLFGSSAFSNKTIGEYYLPFQATNPGCPPGNTFLTCFGNGSYVSNDLGEHVAKTYHPVPLSDQGPIFFNTSNPLSGYNGFDKPFADPQVNEFDIYQTDGTYNFPIRECQTMSSGQGDFASRYNSFEVSQSGKYIAFTSDAMNSLGGTNCGPDWQPNTSYALSAVILPLLNNGAPTISANACTFTVSTPGISGATAPNWASKYTGGSCSGTITDGTVVWTASGNSSCRYDVFVCELK